MKSKSNETPCSIFNRLLKKCGTTAYMVAKGTGLDISTVYSLKNGLYTPKIDKMKKIADYFDVPLETFYENGEVEDDG